MSWDRMHRRHELVHAVLAAVAASGQPVVPGALRAEVEAEFGGEAGLLQEVQLRWYRSFDARLDALLEERPPDMIAALTGLWLDLGAAMPAARFLLDARADHPVLAELDERHRHTLRAATGVEVDLRLLSTPPAPTRGRSRRCWRSLVPRTSTA